MKAKLLKALEWAFTSARAYLTAARVKFRCFQRVRIEAPRFSSFCPCMLLIMSRLTKCIHICIEKTTTSIRVISIMTIPIKVMISIRLICSLLKSEKRSCHKSSKLSRKRRFKQKDRWAIQTFPLNKHQSIPIYRKKIKTVKSVLIFAFSMNK